MNQELLFTETSVNKKLLPMILCVIEFAFNLHHSSFFLRLCQALDESSKSGSCSLPSNET